MEEKNYRVLRIEEQLYGCEELPEGQPVLCDVLLEAADGTQAGSPLPGCRADPAGHQRGQHRHSAGSQAGQSGAQGLFHPPRRDRVERGKQDLAA